MGNIQTNIVRLVLISVFLASFSLSFSQTKGNDISKDKLVSAINGTYPISHFGGEEVIFINKQNKKENINGDEAAYGLFPQLIEKYRYTDYSIRKLKNKIYQIENCCTKHKITLIESDDEDIISEIQEIFSEDDCTACIRKPIIKNIEHSKDDLESTIAALIKGFVKKDAATINKYIYNNQLITLYKIGMPGIYSKEEKVDFEHPPIFWLYQDYTADYNLRYEEVPVYDCYTEGWTKEPGLYCSANSDTLLSYTVKFQIDNMNLKAEDDYRLFKELEKKSKKVVLINEEGNSLVLYLTLINNKWYLTVFDGLSIDCSA